MKEDKITKNKRVQTNSSPVQSQSGPCFSNCCLEQLSINHNNMHQLELKIQNLIQYVATLCCDVAMCIAIARQLTSYKICLKEEVDRSIIPPFVSSVRKTISLCLKFCSYVHTQPHTQLHMYIKYNFVHLETRTENMSFFMCINYNISIRYTLGSHHGFIILFLCVSCGYSYCKYIIILCLAVQPQFSLLQLCCVTIWFL